MFKKISVVFLSLFLFFPVLVFGQEWITTNSSVISWDAVTAMSNGDPIPDTDIIEYVVYLSNAITDPDKSNPIEIGTIDALEYTVTLNVEGKFFVGLRTLRKDAGGTLLGESIIGWSDDPTIVSDGHTFGIRHFLPPMVPTGLRPGT